ncbi:MAG: metallophosphoesterase [Pseudobdellovibrionaceae bacterium]
MQKYFKKIVIGLFLILFAVGIYAVCIEPFRLVITNWTVETPKWQDNPPLKIVLIADTHAKFPSMTEAHIESIVERANAQNPDLILLLGDYVATHPFGLALTPEEGTSPYKKLKAPCGVFAIVGNHDLHPEEQEIGWVDALAATGIPVLRNDTRRLTCEGKTFWIAGMDEWRMGHPDMSKTLQKITDQDPVIMMTHDPDAFAYMSARVALTVAGHTHGGQILIPFYGPVPFVIPSKFGLRYVYGHIQEEGKYLVVTSGLGMTGIPARFLRPPEIAVVTLKSPEK